MHTGVNEEKGLHSISPKQPSTRRRRDWYPYYAGYTQRFVDAVITECLEEATFVIDPWSGSGTTTVTCLKRGVASKGVDVNPAVTVIARARLTPKGCRAKIERVLEEVIKSTQTSNLDSHPSDLLEKWMSPAAATRIRGLRVAIHSVLEQDGVVASGTDLGADRLSPMVSFFYCALFGVVRAMVRRYSATNPMWLKYPLSHRHRIRPSEEMLCTELRRQVAYLADRLSLEEDSYASSMETPFITGNAANLKFNDGVFDGAVTSPPYATRVDYVKGTLPELAVLGANEDYLNRLRSASTGSPTVEGSWRSPESNVVSPYACNLLEAIRSHGSKGSRAYYFPWMANYLVALQMGLLEINRTVKPNCPICVVIQDSYYKEIPVTMQRVVIEMMSSAGCGLTARYDYSAPNPRRQRLGSREGNGQMRENVESLLVFSS